MARMVLLLSFLLLPLAASLALAQDFCVADLTRSATASGYPCKSQSTITANDFYYDGLANKGKINPLIKAGVTPGFVGQFPAVNGMGISAARIDIDEGGVVPLHTHPAGNEILFVTKGTIAAGFISSGTNTVYNKTLHAGDFMVFPQGLLHYQYNAGKGSAAGLVAFSSSNPGMQVTDSALFANDLPSNVVEKVTFLDDDQVKKLKCVLGGAHCRDRASI